MLESVTAIPSSVVNVELFVKFNVPCVNAALLANVPFRFNVPVPAIPPSLLEPVFAVKVPLFVNVPSLSKTAEDAEELLIKAAPEEIFKLFCTSPVETVEVPVKTFVVPVLSVSEIISKLLVPFKLSIPLLSISAPVLSLNMALLIFTVPLDLLIIAAVENPENSATLLTYKA